jgi:23S rRNA (adenine2030-N6)-methyltransferase
MLSYRHGFHAGNFADVHKHAVLAWIIHALGAKAKPFCVLDSHAGDACYDLAGAWAQKTGEWRDGVARIQDCTDVPDALTPYLGALREFRARHGASAYPGSPAIARTLLRQQDRLVLGELHPAAWESLKAFFAGDAQVAVHRRDGWELLGALLPPAERRGLVLVDPPYERAEEYRDAARALLAACRRWPDGVYVLWYPLLAVGRHRAMLDAIAEAQPGPMLEAELLLAPQDTPAGLNGSGLCIINPPWRLDQALEVLQPWLLERMTPGQGGTCRLRWVIPDA